MKDIDFSIIIPAYKEGAIIGASLESLSKFLDSRDYGEVEVIVVTAQGSDNTDKIAGAHANLFKNFRLIDAGPRVGKGRDVRLGMMAARGRYRMFMDADLATPLEHIDEVHRLLKNDAKVIIGVRDLFKIHKGFARKAVTKLANIVVQILVLPGVKDSQCGFKAFEGHAAEEIFSRQKMLSWSFDVEVLGIARFLGYKIHTVEVPDWHDPKTEGNGLVGESVLKVAIMQAKDPLIIRWNLLIGSYRERSYRYEE